MAGRDGSKRSEVRLDEREVRGAVLVIAERRNAGAHRGPRYRNPVRARGCRSGARFAAKAGLRFLEWLNRLPEGSDRDLAVNVTTGAMRELLGPQGYEETLASNVMARLWRERKANG